MYILYILWISLTCRLEIWTMGKHGISLLQRNCLDMTKHIPEACDEVFMRLMSMY